jgi:hypothetical protein
VTPALAVAVGALEAERLAPVPRASHVAAVDVDDLCLLLAHASATAMSADTATAYQRLVAVARACAVSGPARRTGAVP